MLGTIASFIGHTLVCVSARVFVGLILELFLGKCVGKPNPPRLGLLDKLGSGNQRCICILIRLGSHRYSFPTYSDFFLHFFFFFQTFVIWPLWENTVMCKDKTLPTHISIQSPN